MIFACVNTKGGVGKTTLAVHLAGMLSAQHPVLLIDADPQASAASWAAWRKEAGRLGQLTTVMLRDRAVLAEGKPLAQQYMHTVIDAGGRDSGALRSALTFADMALVPLGASSFDTAAMSDLTTVVDLASSFNPGLQQWVVLNRIMKRGSDTRKLRAHIEKTLHLPILDTEICERVAFRRAIADGSLVTEMKTDRDIAACLEVTTLLRELIGADAAEVAHAA